MRLPKAEFRAFVQSRPSVIQALMIEWPPLCVVKTVPGVTLLIPAPGVEGAVESYFEDGCLGVVAPTSIPHPEYGWGTDPQTGERLAPGTLVKAHVDPARLRFVREDQWTRDDVREALS